MEDKAKGKGGGFEGKVGGKQEKGNLPPVMEEKVETNTAISSWLHAFDVCQWCGPNHTISCSCKL